MPEFDQSQRYRRYGALMRPYINHHHEVRLAAHQLAANAIGSLILAPDQVERAKAELRGAGLNWEESADPGTRPGQ